MYIFTMVYRILQSPHVALRRFGEGGQSSLPVTRWRHHAGIIVHEVIHATDVARKLELSIATLFLTKKTAGLFCMRGLAVGGYPVPPVDDQDKSKAPHQLSQSIASQVWSYSSGLSKIDIRRRYYIKYNTCILYQSCWDLRCSLLAWDAWAPNYFVRVTSHTLTSDGSNCEIYVIFPLCEKLPIKATFTDIIVH